MTGRWVLALAVVAAGGAGLAAWTVAASRADSGRDNWSATVRGDPDRGRALFISDGCVLCHAVRGVGGKAGPPLDRTEGMPARDPMDFAADLWMGAPVMLRLQDAWMGYKIDLTGDDLRHLAAFANDIEAQDAIVDEEIPNGLRENFLDQFYIEDNLEGPGQGESWFEFSRRGKDG